MTKGIFQKSIDNALRKDVTEALKSYQLECTELEDFSQHTRCKLIRIKVNQESFALKIYPSEFLDGDLEVEVQFVNHLKMNNSPVPSYRFSKNGALFLRLNNGKKAALYEWIDGYFIKSYTPNQLEKVVNEIKKIHNNSKNIIVYRSDDWLWEDAVQCLSKLELPEAIRSWLTDRIRVGRPWQTTDELIICHNDYTTQNILWSVSEDPYFIDFTNTIFCPPYWDLVTFASDLYLSNAIYSSFENIVANISFFYDKNLSLKEMNKLAEIALSQRAVFKLYNSDSSDKENLLSKIIYYINI